MKRKLTIGIAAVVILIVSFIGFCMWFLSGTGSTYYYSQIDNSKIEQTESKGGVINFSGSMDYSYTLFSYDENGKRCNMMNFLPLCKAIIQNQRMNKGSYRFGIKK